MSVSARLVVIHCSCFLISEIDNSCAFKMDRMDIDEGHTRRQVRPKLEYVIWVSFRAAKGPSVERECQLDVRFYL